MAEHNYTAQVKILGIPDRIVEHGSLKELHRECGFDAKGIAETVREMMKDSVQVNNLLQ
jgi:1-deoxy-D-xylulose-5-phosphate synthase